MFGERIGHECGLAMLRLLREPQYYYAEYGSALWGLQQIMLLMEKQFNRGQDAAGLACLKLHMPPGKPYIARDRSIESPLPWYPLFNRIAKELQTLSQQRPQLTQQPTLLKEQFPFCGEVYLGHLRYGTYGTNSLSTSHPVWRRNNWKTRNLLLAGNFNMTNVDELFEKLVNLGQHPPLRTDTVTMLERLGHFLDQANELIFRKYKEYGYTNFELSTHIARELDIFYILERAAKRWDGGYVMGGVLGHGDMFVCRDPNGIRPAFYTIQPDYVAVASERPALLAAFSLSPKDITELPPAHALVVKADGRTILKEFTQPGQERKCSFERIYFSRSNDPDIYKERKALGRFVAAEVLKAIDYDLENTVFSYIPNTAQIAFYGLLRELEDYQNLRKAQIISQAGNQLTDELLHKTLAKNIRVEQVIFKSTTQRTFISADQSRNELTATVFDVAYGCLRPGKDTLVCIDDSIVRGTTLKQSILRMLQKLEPKKVIIVSSAPQIRYPDCYGIDMSQIEKFVAFQAAIALLQESGQAALIEEVYQRCRAARLSDRLHLQNYITAIYQPFTEAQIAEKIAHLLSPPDFPIPIQIVFQPVTNLPQILPHHTGDWYFTGNYPTPGGNKVVNQAFMNFVEGKTRRAY
jgi:amidophosphoribosyltransferase